MDIGTRQESGQRRRASAGEALGKDTIRESGSDKALRRIESLKFRIVRLEKNYEEGLELYQELWLLLLRRGRQLDEFANQTARIMDIARKIQFRRRRRLQTENHLFQKFRRTVLDSATAEHSLDPFEALDAAEAVRHCWNEIEEPSRQIIRATLTVQGSLREQACAVGLNKSSFLERKRTSLRAIAKVIALHFPCMLSEQFNRNVR